MTERVVVTGIGAFTPLGKDVQENWRRLLNAECGFSVSEFEKCDTKVIGKVDYDIDLSSLLQEKAVRRLDRFSQLSLVAAAETIMDSGITQGDYERIGIYGSSGIGGLETIVKNHNTFLQRKRRGVSPFFIPMSLINMPPCIISRIFGFRGPSLSVVNACASSAHAIGAAYHRILRGGVDAILTGGTESAISELGIAGFEVSGTLTKSENTNAASLPFDKRREGFVISEGAAFLMLEDLKHAKSRGAKIYAEIVGYGSSLDAYSNVAPDPDGRGAILAINMALEDAKISWSQLSSINAHATGTKIGDYSELSAMCKIADKNSAKKKGICANKSSIGHTLGTAGAIEAIFSILSLKEDVLPPVANCNDPEEILQNNFVFTVKKAKSFQQEYILSNSLGFGGTNAVLVFKKYCH